MIYTRKLIVMSLLYQNCIDLVTDELQRASELQKEPDPFLKEMLGMMHKDTADALNYVGEIFKLCNDITDEYLQVDEKDREKVAKEALDAWEEVAKKYRDDSK